MKIQNWRPSRIRTLLIVLVAAAGCGYGEPPPNPEITPAAIGGPGWKVTRRYSVGRALMVDVECRDRERAVEIAESIVQPVTQAYDEVLVYVRPPGGSSTRRVQWTKARGYTLLDY